MPESLVQQRKRTLDYPLNATLLAVAEVMAPALAAWWIIGSAAVALHGAGPVEVADIDVLLDPADALRILPAIGIEPRRGSDHPDFRSEVFGTWHANPLPVEFMAGFHHRRDGHWHPVEPTTRLSVPILHATLFIPSREELRQTIASFGRPKDLLRARMLGGPG